MDRIDPRDGPAMLGEEHCVAARPAANVKGMYYDAHPIEHMSHHLTMLAYDMNGAPLSFGHGAPLRLRNEIELGFKQVTWIKGIEFVAHYSEIGSGYGGYNQDHEFFGYRPSI
jgi:DMSO/TMAO reductase YedYZ molybdopterin-dependent catalytic subunit